MKNPSKPTLLYDGDCGFCRRWIKRWRVITKESIEYSPYQEKVSRFPEIPMDDLRSAVHLIEPDGKVYRAAEAVFRSLAVSKSHRWPLWAYSHLPGFRQSAEFCYRLVAKHRVFFSKILF